MGTENAAGFAIRRVSSDEVDGVRYLLSHCSFEGRDLFTNASIFSKLGRKAVEKSWILHSSRYLSRCIQVWFVKILSVVQSGGIRKEFTRESIYRVSRPSLVRVSWNVTVTINVQSET